VEELGEVSRLRCMCVGCVEKVGATWDGTKRKMGVCKDGRSGSECEEYVTWN
jgi:hypothetical protein